MAARVVFENSVNSRSFLWGGGGGKNTFWMSGLPMFGSWIPSGACFAQMAPECTTEHLFFKIFLGEGPNPPPKQTPLAFVISAFGTKILFSVFFFLGHSHP